jgi:hypothetical protein
MLRSNVLPRQPWARSLRFVSVQAVLPTRAVLIAATGIQFTLPVGRTASALLIGRREGSVYDAHGTNRPDTT